MQFDPEVAALFAAAQAANLPTIDQLDVEPGRALYKAQIAHTGAPRVEVESVRVLDAQGPAGAIPLRLYRPEGLPKGAAPLLIYFHGDGWVIGDLDTHDATCRLIAARTGCLVIAVHYRLGPGASCARGGDGQPSGDALDRGERRSARCRRVAARRRRGQRGRQPVRRDRAGDARRRPAAARANPDLSFGRFARRRRRLPLADAERTGASVD